MLFPKSEVTDVVFSVFCVLCGLFSTDDTEVTDEVFSVYQCALWFNFTQLSEVILNHRV